MGHAKRMLEEQAEGGWRGDPEERVCQACSGIPDAAEFQDSGVVGRCGYCGQRRRVLPAEVAYAVIAGALFGEFDRAVETLPYDSAEGGYQGATLEPMDALAELDWGEAHPRFERELRVALPEDWVTPGWEDEGDDDDHHRDPWEQLRHQLSISRFLTFAQAGDRGRPSDGGFLRLFERVWTGLGMAGCVVAMPPNLELVRAREVVPPAVWFDTVDDLGAPPWKRGGAANRFSAAGVPVFYGSNRLGVALEEVVRKPGVIPLSAGRWLWTDSADAKAVALEALSPRPGPFHRSKRELRDSYKFIESFVKRVSAPPGEEVLDVEYAMTQAFAEYLWLHKEVRAISYRSHRLKKGVHWAIFPTLVRNTPQSPNNSLQLVEHVRLTASRGADGKIRSEIFGPVKRRRAWR